MQVTGLLKIYGLDGHNRTRTLEVYESTTIPRTTILSLADSVPLEAPILSSGVPMAPFNSAEATPNENLLWRLTFREMRRFISVMLSSLILVSIVAAYHKIFRRRAGRPGLWHPPQA